MFWLEGVRTHRGFPEGKLLRIKAPARLTPHQDVERQRGTEAREAGKRLKE